MRSAAFLLLVLASAARAQPGLDAGAIGTAAGVTATATPEGVVRMAWPRDDVRVTIGGARVPVAAGLTSWAALAVAPQGALLRAETVLFDDEVTPALDAALAQGLAVTALDQPMLFAQPRPARLHLEGRGDAVTLATAVKAVWDAARAVRAKSSSPATRPPGEPPRDGDLDTAALGQALGVTVTMDDDVARATFPRAVTLHRTTVAAPMGVASWATFSGSDAAAALDGELALTLPEVQATIRALRAGGIALTALGNHLIGEQPPLWFAHVRASGPAKDLARGLRAALDAQRAARR